MSEEFKIGDIVSGTVSNIQSYGAFINLSNNHSGLLHISEISNKFVKNIESYFKIGDTIRVKIIGIDEKSEFYRLSLKQFNERERQVLRKPPRITKPRRTKIFVDDSDFAPLKEKLPEWILKTLKEETKDD